MNYSLFKIKNYQTKSISTHQIEAITKVVAVVKAKNNGLESIMNNQHNDKQNYSLGIYVPEDASKLDVSALISHAVDKDRIPYEDLVEFATSRSSPS